MQKKINRSIDRQKINERAFANPIGEVKLSLWQRRVYLGLFWWSSRHIWGLAHNGVVGGHFRHLLGQGESGEETHFGAKNCRFLTTSIAATNIDKSAEKEKKRFIPRTKKN
jgi:hypothetical protein